MRGRPANNSSSHSQIAKPLLPRQLARAKVTGQFSLTLHSNLFCDKDLTDWTVTLRPWFTWKHFEALDYLTASGLHGDPVVTHQERKHDEGHKLAGVGLQGTEWRKQSGRNELILSYAGNSCWQFAQNIADKLKNWISLVVAFLLSFRNSSFPVLQHSAVKEEQLANPHQMRNGGEVSFIRCQTAWKRVQLGSVKPALLILENSEHTTSHKTAPNPSTCWDPMSDVIITTTSVHVWRISMPLWKIKSAL